MYEPLNACQFAYLLHASTSVISATVIKSILLNSLNNDNIWYDYTCIGEIWGKLSIFLFFFLFFRGGVGGKGCTECRSLNIQKRGILRTFLSRSSTQPSFELQYCISSDLVLRYVNVVYDPGKGNRHLKVLQCTQTMKNYPSVTIFMWYFLKASLIYNCD